VAPFLGFFGIVALALMLGSEDRIRRLDRQLGWSGAAVIGAGTLVLTWWGATQFRSMYFPTLSDHVIYLTVFVVSVSAALLVTRWWRIALSVLATFAVVSTLQVNPLMHGLGKLEESAAADRVRALDASIVGPAHGAWAADTVEANGLLNGQGVNSLSSFNDPVDEKGWHVLDPHNHGELAWNRYGYIVFDWQPKLSGVQIGAPVTDQVYVFIDPCNAKLDRLHLKMLLSSRKLPDADCLDSRGTIRWQGTNYHVYERA
jgi:hypothetical protein